MPNDPTSFKDLPDSYWKEKVMPEHYRICREGGTKGLVKPLPI